VAKRADATICRLPLHSGRDPAIQTLVVPPAGVEVEDELTRWRVLVVDDEVLFTTALRRVLQRTHHIEIADNGPQALHLIRSGARYDVIFSDVTMPLMTGPEFLDELERIAPEQAGKVVFLTGGVFSGPLTLRLSALGTLQLEKPVELDLLRATISRIAQGAATRPRQPGS
jgi:CheY-like chemotaxis protein